MHPWPKKERHVEGSWSYGVFVQEHGSISRGLLWPEQVLQDHQFGGHFLLLILTSSLSTVKVSIRVLRPPICCKKLEGSTFAFSIALIAASTSVAGTFLLLAAVLSIATCYDTSSLLSGAANRNSSSPSSSSVEDGSNRKRLLMSGVKLRSVFVISTWLRTDQKSEQLHRSQREAHRRVHINKQTKQTNHEVQWSSHYKQEVFTRLSSRKRSLHHILLLLLRDSSSSFNYPPGSDSRPRRSCRTGGGGTRNPPIPRIVNLRWYGIMWNR